jgi:hypothetical protein
MTHLNINAVNLKTMVDSGHLKDYATFLWLKGLYSNSCILNYTQKSLSIKSGISLSGVRRYVKLFLDKGWCRMHKGNLVFNKLKTFDHNKKKIIFKFQINDSVKQVLKDLQLFLLKKKQEDFYKLVKLSSDLSKPQNNKVYKNALKRVKKHDINKESLPGEGTEFSISMKKIALVLGCSIGSAAGKIKQMRQEGLVWCVTGRKEIMPVKDPYYIKWLLNVHPNSYYHNGFIYSVCCNKYKF